MCEMLRGSTLYTNRLLSVLQSFSSNPETSWMVCLIIICIIVFMCVCHVYVMCMSCAWNAFVLLNCLNIHVQCNYTCICIIVIIIIILSGWYC